MAFHIPSLHEAHYRGCRSMERLGCKSIDESFLDKTIAECERLSEVSRNAQGYALFVDARPHDENRSKDDENQSEHDENWSQDDENWFREMRRQYHDYGGSKYYRMLGVHPDKGGPIDLKFGPYGTYVEHNDVDANVPRGKLKSLDSITLSEAIVWLDDAHAKKTLRGTRCGAPQEICSAPLRGHADMNVSALYDP